MFSTLLLAQRATLPPQFPPGPAITTVTVLIHVALLLLVIGSIAGLFFTIRRPTRIWDLLIWPIIIVSAFAIASWYTGPDETQIFIVGYAFFVLLIAIFGLGIGFIRVFTNSAKVSRAGCTVVALVVLAVFIALLLPATPSVREAARRTDCKNRIRQIAIAMHNWHDAFGRLPDMAISDGTNPTRSWRVELLPFMEGDSTRQKYRDDRRWDDAENLPVAQTNLQDLRCPSVKHAQNQHDEFGRYFTHYLAVTGPNTIFANGKGMNLDDIANGDGTTKTLLLVEASGRNIVWTEPRDADTAVQPIGINLLGNSVYDSPSLLSTYHPAGANIAFADASTFTVPKKIDPKILKALTTTNGNDPAERGF